VRRFALLHLTNMGVRLESLEETHASLSAASGANRSGQHQSCS
jgi:hypothetical protein